MSPGQRRPSRSDDEEELGNLRKAAIGVFIALSAFLMVADVFGPNDYKTDPLMAGLVFGTLLSLLGLEGIQRLIDRD